MLIELLIFFDLFWFVIYVRSDDLDLFFFQNVVSQTKISQVFFDKIQLAKECWNLFFWQNKTKQTRSPPNKRISSAEPSKASGSGTITWSRTSSIFRWCFSRLHCSLGISASVGRVIVALVTWLVSNVFCLFGFVKVAKLRKMCENDLTSLKLVDTSKILFVLGLMSFFNGLLLYWRNCCFLLSPLWDLRCRWKCFKWWWLGKFVFLAQAGLNDSGSNLAQNISWKYAMCKITIKPQKLRNHFLMCTDFCHSQPFSNHHGSKRCDSRWSNFKYFVFSPLEMVDMIQFDFSIF